MTLENFKINDDLISIDYANQYLDLHNNFEFGGLNQLNKETVELIFTKGNGNWIKEDELNGFKLKFKNVTNVITKQSDSDYPLEYLEQDNKTPDIFGFSYRGEEIMEGPTDNSKSDDELQALLFTFVTGRAIKIEAASVELIK